MVERNYNAAVDFVDRHIAEGRANKTAYIDPARNLTYGELHAAATRVGPMLARLGVERENRIALILLDTVDFPVVYWGAVRAGVVPVLMNTRLTVDQYRYLLEDSRAKEVLKKTGVRKTATTRRTRRKTTTRKTDSGGILGDIIEAALKPASKTVKRPRKQVSRRRTAASRSNQRSR